VSDDTQEVNPPPPEVAVAAFVAREVVAFLFVFVWLLLFAGSLVTGAYAIPLWFHMVAVSVLGYALGLNVAELTAARPPDKRDLLRRARQRQESVEESSS